MRDEGEVEVVVILEVEGLKNVLASFTDLQFQNSFISLGAGEDKQDL